MNVEQFYPIFLRAENVTIDSRKVNKNDIFFAFSGDHFNAALFAEDAIALGAIAVVVEQEKYENKDKNIFYVSSTLLFLQELAYYHRQQLSIPIIGITGSNGKTTTKELIHAVLSKKFQVQYTFGNLNNHIGVPLTLLSIKKHHDIAVVEMGANHQKEIAFLANLSQPTLGYITNFGKAHLEGFGGFEGVILGKSELYSYLIENNEKIIVNKVDGIQNEKTINYPEIITFGTEDSDYFFEEFSENNAVGLVFQNSKAKSNLTGNYNFTNLCAAATVGLYFNIDFFLIKEAIENYQPTNMRSQIVEKNEQTLVLDTYNANPSSMIGALQNFKNFEGSKTVIIGDMLELGTESKMEHEKTLNLANSLLFDEVITVGKEFAAVNGAHSFHNVLELIDYLKTNKITTKNILLKASRGIALEKIIEFL